MNNFAEACKMSYSQWESTLLNFDELPEPQYSKKHKKEIEKLFDKMRENKYHRLTSRTFQTILIAAVLFSILTLGAFANPSSREFIIEYFDDFGIFSVAEKSNERVFDIEVGYIPEGFELVDDLVTEVLIDRVYESNNGESFSISKNVSTTQIGFNAEDAVIEKIVSDGITYSIITNSSEYTHIIWTKNNYVYDVNGTISKENLIKIAKNLK